LLVSAEAGFTRDGMFNCRNSHLWTENNCHARHAANQQRYFSINVWAGTIWDDLVGFEVLTAVTMKIAVFWVVAPCSLVEVYQRFRGPCCLHHQGPDDGGSKDL
jgi:hypothetical protein